MQDKIIASHTWMLNVSDALKWTTNTHMTQFSLTFKATNNIYWVFSLLLFYQSTHISTRPHSFLPVQMTGGQVST